MAVEDHPLYQEWSAAFDLYVEAEKRYRKAQMSNDVYKLPAAKLERDKALTAYKKIADRID